ncbi:MAG: DUF1622 domain-containing protein [Verrucomicrobiales bacterium]|nr:DUF1622 domain-containing protein [Verrucomicrobiales bacterium]
MEELFKEVASAIALGMEAAAILLIAIGALEAIVGTASRLLSQQAKMSRRKEVWLRFAAWLLLGLEFELAADVVRTAISPTWNEIGQLAAIAVIRTGLNYFLERDLEKYGEPPSGREPAAA